MYVKQFYLQTDSCIVWLPLCYWSIRVLYLFVVDLKPFVLERHCTWCCIVYAFYIHYKNNYLYNNKLSTFNRYDFLTVHWRHIFFLLFFRVSGKKITDVVEISLCYRNSSNSCEKYVYVFYSLCTFLIIKINYSIGLTWKI